MSNRDHTPPTTHARSVAALLAALVFTAAPWGMGGVLAQDSAPTTPAPATAPAAQPTGDRPAAERPAGDRPAADRPAAPVGPLRERPVDDAIVDPATASSPGSFALIDGKESPIPDIKMGDPAIIAKIIDEGKNRNQVMKHLEHLSKTIGHRLTGATSTEVANRWLADVYKQWGFSNIQVEEWGTIATRFDRGPCSGKLVVKKDGTWQPAADLHFTSYSWSAGTNGPQRGHVIKLPQNEDEYSAVKDKLKGAWILLPQSEGTGMQRAGTVGARYRQCIDVRKKVAEEKTDPATLPVDDRIIFDGILGFVAPTRELVITSSVRGWRDLDAKNVPPDIMISVRKAHYEDIVKRLDAGEDFALEFDMKHTFKEGPIPCYNTIAEIPGTTWPEQVVIVSGHLDSWDGPGSEGTNDNGTGTATTLETARILMAVGAKPKRTIRFIHWTGEEQGLLGSAAYVEKHKDDIVKNVSACLVDDGGTNYDGGLPAADQMIPYLAAATAPINNVFYSDRDKKFMNVNIKPTGPRLRVSGGSDHMSFNRVGVPGFFWTETGLSNYSYMHHTQYDDLSNAVPEYLVQSATAGAITAYNLACADELLPRNQPVPEGEEPGEGERPRRRRDGDTPPTPPNAAAPAASPAATAPATAPAAATPAKDTRPKLP